MSYISGKFARPFLSKGFGIGQKSNMKERQGNFVTALSFFHFVVFGVKLLGKGGQEFLYKAVWEGPLRSERQKETFVSVSLSLLLFLNCFGIKFH